MDPTAFLNLCGAANTLIDKAERQFESWLSNVSFAYGKAWEVHQGFAKEIEESLKEDFALDAALLFLGGVGGSIAGAAIKKAMKLGGSENPILSGATKLSDKGIDWALGKARPSSPKVPALPVSPGLWQNNINARVKAEMAIITGWLEAWQLRASKPNDYPSFKTDFDPHAAIEQALAVPIDPNGLATALAAIMKAPAEVLKELSKTELLRRPSEDLLRKISKKLNIDVGAVYGALTSPKDAIQVSELKSVNRAELQKEFERGFLAFWLLETAPFGSSMGSMEISQPHRVRARDRSSGPLLPEHGVRGRRGLWRKSSD